jgi:hypothetical protein
MLTLTFSLVVLMLQLCELKLRLVVVLVLRTSSLFTLLKLLCTTSGETYIKRDEYTPQF